MYFSQNDGRRSRIVCSSRIAATLLAALGLSALAAAPGVANPEVDRVAKASVVPISERVFEHARLLGHQANETRMHIAFTLPLQHQAEMADLLRRLYDHNDPLYGHFLTPQQFASRFGASQQDFDAVVAYARSVGLTIDHTSGPRTMVMASGQTSAVEAAFGVNVNRYLMTDGRIAYANDRGPTVAPEIAAKIGGIVGLNNVTRRHHAHYKLLGAKGSILSAFSPHANSGPAGGLGPVDIKKAYGLDKVTLSGEGQAVALYELDGYDPADVTTYTTQFNLGTPNLTNVLVGGFNGLPGTDQSSTAEVVLDIDMVLALSPKLKNLLVYEADRNNDAEVLANYQRIADDNLASVVSTSWGTPEQTTDAFKQWAQTEDSIFQQMAIEGQTIYDASGDAGAYDDGSTISVDDPAGHPTVMGVGGTTLTLNTDGTYKSETVWKGTLAGAAANDGGSGGGVSAIWPIPSYQVPLAGKASTTFRNVPDVALDADYTTGYDIYVPGGGGWQTAGGTSAAAPLWAAFTALINQQRALTGLGPLGYYHQNLYTQVETTATYTALFNDILTGDNLFYLAGPGYDNATGLGSFKGASWLTVFGGASGQTGTLAGYVRDTGGAPIAGATVTAYVLSTGTLVNSATTDATGHYTFTLASGPTFRVKAVAGGYEGQILSLTVAPQTTTGQDFTVVPAHVFPAGLQMISSPEDFNNIASIDELLIPISSSTPYSPNMFTYAPYQGLYVQTPTVPADTLRVGNGYWVRFPGTMYIALRGNTTPTNAVYRQTLQAGWNMIGSPFPVAVNIPGIQVDTLTSSGPQPITSSSLVKLPLYSYDQTSNAYIAHSADQIQPYVGYWIYAAQACQLVVTPPGGITITPPPQPFHVPMRAK